LLLFLLLRKVKRFQIISECVNHYLWIIFAATAAVQGIILFDVFMAAAVSDKAHTHISEH
jgi:hypothetical protein